MRGLQRLGIEDLFEHSKSTFVNYKEIVDTKLRTSPDRERIKRFLDWNMAAGELRTSHLAKNMPGSRYVLDFLSKSSCKIGIVSSNSKRVIERTGRRFHLIRFLDSVWGREDEGRSKPDPDKLMACSASLVCSSSFYIGDDPTDMQAAKAAGLVGITVLRRTDRLPTPSYAALKAAGATAVVNSLIEIPETLRKLGLEI